MSQNLLHFHSWHSRSRQAFHHGSLVPIPGRALNSVVVDKRYCIPGTANDLTADNRNSTITATETNPITANEVATAMCSNLGHITSPPNTHIATTAIATVSAPLSSSLLRLSPYLYLACPLTSS